MTINKYELTSNTKRIGNIILYQIKALRTFNSVKAGDFGGYIEKESNLGQSGNAWVYDDAWVYGNAKVYGNAWVCGNAKVSGNAEIYESTHIYTCGPIGSRNGITTFYRATGNKINVICGCFDGSIDDFKKAVIATHKGTKHKKTYLVAIKLAKIQLEVE